MDDTFASKSSSLAGRPRVAVMWRGDPRAPQTPAPHEARLRPIIDALGAAGFDAQGIVWFDEDAARIAAKLSQCAGVLVWINPLADGRDRTTVDGVLREVARQGAWVSAHPDVILAMGTKEVLFRTRDLGCGSDTDLYDTPDAFEARFWARLDAAQTRVLKPLRGNDGQGVLKVAAAGDRVSLQHASDDRSETLAREALSARVREVFAQGAKLIDQAFHDNLAAGMVRCYLSLDRVIGFAEQQPRREAGAFGMNSAKTMHDAVAPQFADLRASMEQDWVPGMQRILRLEGERLPALWDADFLYRAPAAVEARGRFVLCEINVSCVSPFPPAAPAMVAEAVRRCLAG